MCDQLGVVIKSPNHWCANSWAFSPRADEVEAEFSGKMAPIVCVVQLKFSIPPNMNSGTTD
jgi:hypothetical protein